MLGAADIDGHIVALRAHADYHTGIDLRAGAYEHRAALLSVPDAVGDCFAGLERDEGACIAAGDIALVRLVLFKDGGHDALTLGVGQKLVAVAEKSSGRDKVGQLYTAAHRQHLDKLALASA